MKKAVAVAIAVACGLFAFCGCNKAAGSTDNNDGGVTGGNEYPDLNISGEVKELLTVEELVEFHKNGPKYPENFIFEELKGYGRVLNSASSADEARAAVENRFTNNMNTTVENRLEVETELFYGLYAKWGHYSGESEKPSYYDEYVVSFKSDVYDAESGEFGTDDSDVIKKIIDYIYYSRTYQIGGSKVYGSEISLKDGKYRYLINLLEVCYGDWDMADRLTLTRYEWNIDATTGETEVADGEVFGTVFVYGNGSFAD